MNNVTKNNDKFDLDKFLKSVELCEDIDTIYPRITERRANLAMVGVNARTYIHWRDLDLVGEKPTKGEPKLWVRLNLYDFVWLKIIKVLREFGIPLGDIKELKKMLFTNYIELFENDIEEIFEILRSETNIDENKLQEQKKIIEYSIENKNDLSNEEKHLTTILGMIIHSILFASDEASIIIYKTESGFSYSFYTFKTFDEYAKQISECLSVPHLNIPLKSFIEEFMNEPKNESNLEIWGFINKNEKKVLEALRNKNFKEITIKKINGDTDSLIIDAFIDGDIIEQKAIEIKKVLGLNLYSEITIKYRNEKHLYFKNKIRL